MYFLVALMMVIMFRLSDFANDTLLGGWTWNSSSSDLICNGIARFYSFWVTQTIFFAMYPVAFFDHARMIFVVDHAGFSVNKFSLFGLSVFSIPLRLFSTMVFSIRTATQGFAILATVFITIFIPIFSFIYTFEFFKRFSYFACTANFVFHVNAPKQKSATLHLPFLFRKRLLYKVADFCRQIKRATFPEQANYIMERGAP